MSFVLSPSHPRPDAPLDRGDGTSAVSPPAFLRLAFKHAWVLAGATVVVTAALWSDLRWAQQALGFDLAALAPSPGLAPLLGFLLGVLLAGLREAVDTRLQRAEDVKRHLDLDVLAALPDLPAEQVPGDTFASASARRRLREGKAVAPAFARAVRVRDARARDRCFQSLAQRLDAQIGLPGVHDSAATGEGRVLVVTSARPGEGKSGVARALAKQLTLMQGGRVLLIAANARHADNADGPPGLHELLADPDTPVRVRPSHGLPRLHKLPIGQAHAPAEGIDPEAVLALLARTRSRYAWTVIDAGELPDAAPWADEADGTVLVVDALHTPRAAVRAGLQQAALAPEQLLGVVLNRQPQHLPRGLARHWL
jgi:Mrp family chromosome partitioning ATPase